MSGQNLTWAFDSVTTGQLPAGATTFSGSWAVQADTDAPSAPNALCQTGTAEYPALALSDEAYGDVTVTASFKPISGQADQAAGLIFRVQDADNYYILRANALESNVNLYEYVGGHRTQLKGGAGQIVTGQWATLRAEAAGSTLRGYLNGKLVVETSDETFAAGRVGRWTKADSVTCFDDVAVTTP